MIKVDATNTEGSLNVSCDLKPSVRKFAAAMLLAKLINKVGFVLLEEKKPGCGPGCECVANKLPWSFDATWSETAVLPVPMMFYYLWKGAPPELDTRITPHPAYKKCFVIAFLTFDIMRHNIAGTCKPIKKAPQWP